MTLGSTDALTLAAAREEARNVLFKATKGEDPATRKQLGRQAETMGELAELYLTKWAMPRKRSWKADANLLRRKVLPKWQHRRVFEITRQDVRLLVESVAESGAPVVANRVASLLSKVFNFALDRDLIPFSPAVRIPRPTVEYPRDRVLTEDEIRTLWHEFEKLDETMGAFYKLRLVTAQRGGEVATMKWSDVDLKNAWWTIPSTSSKNRLSHRVPLNAGALAILKRLRAQAGEILAAREARNDTKSHPIIYVLDGARGKRQWAHAAAKFSVPDFKGHDLRRTAASYMASSGVPRLTIAKILNHVERGVTAVYDRHSYDLEKRAALDGWWRQLRAITQPLRIVGGGSSYSS
jgi:integrase